MKKEDIISKVLETAKKLTDADGIPLDICDDFRKCITMIQEINSIEFISVKKEFTLTPTIYPDDHVGGN